MNRRKFLTIVGGGAIVAAGLSTYVSTRTPKRALKPWEDAGSLYTEPRKKALSYAILAPNPHNRQPWKIDLSEPDTVKILVDTNRLLPETDPFSRQIIIGFGCFLEVLRMAAAEDGYLLEEQLFPEGANPQVLDNRPVAVVKFIKDTGVVRDALFAQVLQRRSLKEPFDTQKIVSDQTLKSLEQSINYKLQVGTTNDVKQVDELRDLTTKALQLEIDTPRTYRESVELFRIGKAEVEANPDGIDFSGPLFETLALFGQFSRELALDTSSSAYQEGISAVLENTRTAMAYVWLVTETNTREDQIIAGRDWVRINLVATSMGLGTQPLSQVLQEYPEMKEFYDQTHAMFAQNGGTVQMLARLGYGVNVAPSPRWNLSAKLVHG